MATAATLPSLNEPNERDPYNNNSYGTLLDRPYLEVQLPILDVRDFNNVLEVDRAKAVIDVEGMTPYATLVDESLKHGVLPAVVPQLKSIGADASSELVFASAAGALYREVPNGS